MRTAIAAAMARSKREIPHYYLQHQVDVTPCEQWIARANEARPPDSRLLMGALAVRAVALAARNFTAFNGFYREGSYEPAAAVHIGVAVAIRGGGLAAPALHDADRISLDEVMAAEMMSYPNTLLMCCPNTDGSAAVVLVSEEKLRTLSKDQQKRAVKISASALTTDPWTEHAQVQPDVNTLTRNAAKQAYETAGVSPQDLDLVELHDCFATAELIHYDNLMLCEPGGAGKFIDERGPWRDGKIPVNVSGGLISKGHPIGATGIANVFEVSTHLRGEAGDRQIEAPRSASPT